MRNLVPEISRHPTYDVAVIDLGPGLKLSIPMKLIAQHGAIHADWIKLSEKVDEVYSVLTLGIPPTGGISLKELLGGENVD